MFLKNVFHAIFFILVSTANMIAVIPSNTFSKTNIFQIKIERLSLYNVLVNTKKIISDNYFDENTNSENNNLSEALSLINQELELLKYIVDGFNHGENQYIQARFISLCMYFQGKDAIEPRHLRAFKNKVEKFNDYVQKYISEQRSFLSKDKIDMCEKIIKFNEILVSSLLNYEYFEIDIFDKIVDWTIHRPIEGAKAHPYITTAVIVTIITVLGVWLYKRSQTSKPDPNPLINSVPGGNTPSQTLITVEDYASQDVSVENQQGLCCGRHALMNLLAHLGLIANKPETGLTKEEKDNKRAQAAELLKIICEKAAQEYSPESIDAKRTSVNIIFKKIEEFNTEINHQRDIMPKLSFWESLFGCSDKEKEKKVTEIRKEISRLDTEIAFRKAALLENQTQIQRAKTMYELATSESFEDKKRFFSDMPSDYIVEVLNKYAPLKEHLIYCLGRPEDFTALSSSEDTVGELVNEVQNKAEDLAKYFNFQATAGTEAKDLTVTDDVAIDPEVWSKIIKPLYDGKKQDFKAEDLKRAATREAITPLVLANYTEAIPSSSNAKLIEAKKALLENGTPIHFIARIGYHWIYYRAYKDGEKIKIAYADSEKKSDHTTSQQTTALYRFLQQQ